MASVDTNPLRPSESEAPGRHVRFSETAPVVADVIFDTSPTKTFKRATQTHHDPETEKVASKAAGESGGVDADQPVAEDTEKQAGAATADVPEASSSESEDADVDVCERLFAKGQRSARRRERAAQRALVEREARDANESTFHPELSAGTRKIKGAQKFSLRRFLHETEKKTVQSKRLFEKKRDKILSDRLEECQPEARARPDPLSDRLVRRMARDGEYGGPVKAWHRHFADFLVKRSGSGTRGQDRSIRSTSASRSVAEKAEESRVFERLYQQAETRRAAQELMQAAQLEAEGSQLFRPLTNHRVSRIHSAASASLQRAAAAEHADASSQRQRSTLAALGVTPMRADVGGDATTLDPAFGMWQETTVFADDGDDEARHRLGTVIDADALIASGDPSPPRDASEVVDALLSKGHEYTERAEARRIAADREAMKDCTFKPQTNPTSKKILQRVAGQVDDGSFGNGRRASPPGSNDQEFAAAQGAFPPSGLRKPESEIMRSLQQPQKCGSGRTPRAVHEAPKPVFDADVFTARAQRQAAERAEKVAQLRRAREAQESAECTFRPRLAPQSRDGPAHEPKLATSPHYVTARRPPAQEAPNPTSLASPAPRTPRVVPRRSHVSEHARAAESHLHVPAAPRSQTAAVVQVPASEQRLDEATESLDDGMAYLEALERELQGVLEDWRSA